MVFTKEIVLNILHNNDNIKDAISLIEELDIKKQKNYLLDSQNKPFAIFCYYHKKWELVSETKYGVKNSSKTGLNTMCKVGTNKWNIQRKESIRAKSELLVQLMDNLIKQEDIKQLNDEIDRAKDQINLENYTGGYSLKEVCQGLINHNLNIGS